MNSETVIGKNRRDAIYESDISEKEKATDHFQKALKKFREPSYYQKVLEKQNGIRPRS